MSDSGLLLAAAVIILSQQVDYLAYWPRFNTMTLLMVALGAAPNSFVLGM